MGNPYGVLSTSVDLDVHKDVVALASKLGVSTSLLVRVIVVTFMRPSTELDFISNLNTEYTKLLKDASFKIHSRSAKSNSKPSSNLTESERTLSALYRRKWKETDEQKRRDIEVEIQDCLSEQVKAIYKERDESDIEMVL